MARIVKVRQSDYTFPLTNDGTVNGKIMLGDIFGG